MQSIDKENQTIILNTIPTLALFLTLNPDHKSNPNHIFNPNPDTKI